MNQDERCTWLIRQLLREQRWEEQIEIPDQFSQRQHLLRGLMNVRPPWPMHPKWLRIQDDYLQTELNSSVISEAATLPELEPGISLWQGDITKIKADAIVNAANNALLGCFIPNHGCIDNAIHSAAGIQLRLACQTLRENQKMPEPVGQAEITPGFNLPALWVLHTVGPQVRGVLTSRHCEQLAACYTACLQKAAACQLKTLVFCCISTGEYHFPSQTAAQIAIRTVRTFLRKNDEPLKVVFNVFRDHDAQLYRAGLGCAEEEDNR